MTIAPIFHLLLLVIVLENLYKIPALRKIIRFIPLPLLCYTLPMLLVSQQWIPREDPSYAWMLNRVLPMALALLLLQTHLGNFIKVGRSAFFAALGSWLGLGGGLIIGLLLFQHALPEDAWKGVGLLAATWNGGSLNMVAVGSLLDASKALFAPLLIVDALIAYGWMALLVASSSHTHKIERCFGLPPLDTMRPTLAQPQERSHNGGLQKKVTVPFLVAVVITGVAYLLAQSMPENSLISSVRGWHILIVTTLTICVASLPRIRFDSAFTNTLGTTLLYWVLAYLGSQGDLKALTETPAWLWVGLMAAITQLIALILMGRWKKISWPILALASQANMGGMVSAPIVAATFHPSLVPIGLLLAIGCQSVGTYSGLCIAQLAKALIGGF